MVASFSDYEWQEREDSNPRPLVLETSALAKLSYAPTFLNGTPGGTRTPDARLRTPPLYPLSYRGLVEIGGIEPPTSALRTPRSPN